MLRRRLSELAARPGRPARVATAAVSPVGALALWAGATYVWLVPPTHRLAVPAGPIHLLDHVSFLAFGLLIWLGVFDPRTQREPLRALRFGGLPWWGRHVYAIVTRLAMLPPAFALWLAAPSAYHDALRGWSFSLTQAKDQELAASVMIGFEMLLFALAVVLAFIFLSVAEGRERSRAT